MPPARAKRQQQQQAAASSEGMEELNDGVVPVMPKDEFLDGYVVRTYSGLLILTLVPQNIGFYSTAKGL